MLQIQLHVYVYINMVIYSLKRKKNVYAFVDLILFEHSKSIRYHKIHFCSFEKDVKMI